MTSPMPPDTYRLPASVAAALTTGRPELVRLGDLGEDPAAAREMLNDYAEGLVRFAFEQRDVLAKLALELQHGCDQLRGGLGIYERITDALGLAAAGASTEAVLDAMKNPAREQERARGLARLTANREREKREKREGR